MTGHDPWDRVVAATLRRFPGYTLGTLMAEDARVLGMAGVN